MKSLEKMAELADRFEYKLNKFAQSQGAQAGDIEKALKDAGVWVEQNAIAPLLNTAKIPDNVSLLIDLVVDSGLRVAFKVAANPPHGASKMLEAILNKTYSPRMSKALKDANVSVGDTITVKVAKFDA